MANFENLFRFLASSLIFNGDRALKVAWTANMPTSTFCATAKSSIQTIIPGRNSTGEIGSDLSLYTHSAAGVEIARRGAQASCPRSLAPLAPTTSEESPRLSPNPAIAGATPSLGVAPVGAIRNRCAAHSLQRGRPGRAPCCVTDGTAAPPPAPQRAQGLWRRRRAPAATRANPARYSVALPGSGTAEVTCRASTVVSPRFQRALKWA